MPPSDDNHSGAAESRSQALLQSLRDGLEQMALKVTEEQQQSMIDYVLLLERWNKIHNLTAIRRAEQMISRHLLDSLTVIPFLRGNSIIDVGSGAGLPGIPLSITNPELNCLMVDRSQRKTLFVQQAVATLKLANASVMHSRVENLQLPTANGVVARAFSSPVDIINSCRHMCNPGGVMIFMMGHVSNQFEQLPDDFRLDAVHKVSVAGSDATRHIAVCSHSE